MKKTKFKFFDDMGLCISDGAMCYGWKHGWFRWAPAFFKHGIASVWNWAHCAIAGHDTFGYTGYTQHVLPGPPTCSNCCARLKIDGRHPTPEEIKIHDEICHKNWEEADAKWRLEYPEEAKAHDEWQEKWINEEAPPE